MSVDTSGRSIPWLHIALTAILLACLWAGWQDFDPWIPRGEVREIIRSSIRREIQVLVQYVIPGAIVIFLGKEALAKLQRKQRGSGNKA